MLGSPTIHEPIIASMCDSSRESGNQNIFFITGRVFFSDSLTWRFIILCNVSMMSYSVSLLLLRATFVFGIVSGDVSFLIACKASDTRKISVKYSRVVFLVRVITFVMMIVCSSFLGVYCEILIFTSHLFFSGYYSIFFL